MQTECFARASLILKASVLELESKMMRAKRVRVRANSSKTKESEWKRVRRRKKWGEKSSTHLEHDFDQFELMLIKLKCQCFMSFLTHIRYFHEILFLFSASFCSTLSDMHITIKTLSPPQPKIIPHDKVDFFLLWTFLWVFFFFFLCIFFPLMNQLLFSWFSERICKHSRTMNVFLSCRGLRHQYLCGCCCCFFAWN